MADPKQKEQPKNPLEDVKKAVGTTGVVQEIANKALLIVVRLHAEATEEQRQAATKVVAELAADIDVPVVLCPKGMNIRGEFEPSEMKQWRDEIMQLRREVSQERERADAAERKLKSLAAGAR